MPVHDKWQDHYLVETYYGLECACGLFIPHDGEPWLDPDQLDNDDY